MRKSRLLWLGVAVAVLAAVALALTLNSGSSVGWSQSTSQGSGQKSMSAAEFTSLASDEQQSVVDAMPRSADLDESVEGTAYQSGTVLVSFKEPAFEEGSESLTDSAREALSGLVSVEQPETFGPGKIDEYTATLKVRDGISVSKAVAEVNNNGDFEISQPNYIYQLAASTNDPLSSKQWAINNSSETLKKAWDEQKVEGSVTVAVLDTGIDTDHEDLSGNIVEATTRIERGDWSDPNNPKWYWDTSNPEDISSNGHGSHCAGIVSAVSNNGKGVSGVSYNAKILSVRVFDGGFAMSSDVCKGIEYAIEKRNQYNVRVISMSLGASYDWQDPVYNRWAAKAADAGISVVAASGNDYANFVSTPANSTGVIAVGALNSNGQRASYSNYGAHLDVMAPGHSIYSTGKNNNYVTLDGTSMAAPYVAGVAALCYAANPDLTPAQFEKLLKDTASRASNQSILEYGAGKVNPYKAVLAAKDLICYHDLTDVYILNNTQATCQSEGYSGDTYCPKCNKMISKGYTIAKLSHEIEYNVTRAATCTEAGEKVGKCKTCSLTETQSIAIDPDAHAFVEVEAKAATCTTDGWNAHSKCERCNTTIARDRSQGIVIPAEHQHLTEFAQTPATCTTNRYTGFQVCLVCYELVGEHREVKGTKTAHDYDEQGTCKNCTGKATDEEAIYHLYNKVSDENLYTPDKDEYEAKKAESNWEDKGVAWIATTVESASTQKVYRLYNAMLDRQGKTCHYYSKNATEIYILTAFCGWSNEGDKYSFLSGGDVAIWMTYRDSLLGNTRLYTADASEWETLVGSGWDRSANQNGTTGTFQGVRLAN